MDAFRIKRKGGHSKAQGNNMERARGNRTVRDMRGANLAQTHRFSSSSIRTALASDELKPIHVKKLNRSNKLATEGHMKKYVTSSSGDSTQETRAKKSLGKSLKRQRTQTQDLSDDLLNVMAEDANPSKRRKVARTKLAHQLEKNTANVPSFGQQDGMNVEISSSAHFNFSEDGRPATPGSNASFALHSDPDMQDLLGKPTLLVNEDGFHPTATGNLIKPDLDLFSDWNIEKRSNLATTMQSNATVAPPPDFKAFDLDDV